MTVDTASGDGERKVLHSRSFVGSVKGPPWLQTQQHMRMFVRENMIVVLGAHFSSA